MTTKHTIIFIGLAIIGVAIFVALTLFMNKSTNSDDIEIEEKQVNNNNSKSFLIVDIDGDGFDFIPLQESKTYFDVDGDKLAEKTEWIKPSDAFLQIMSRNEDRGLSDIYRRIMALQTEGKLKLHQYDKNQDGIFDVSDFDYFRDQKFNPLGFSIAKDRDLNGIVESKKQDLVPCDFFSIKIPVDNEEGILFCEGGKEYRIKNIKFNYEDTNSEWQVICSYPGILKKEGYGLEYCQ